MAGVIVSNREQDRVLLEQILEAWSSRQKRSIDAVYEDLNPGEDPTLPSRDQIAARVIRLRQSGLLDVFEPA